MSSSGSEKPKLVFFVGPTASGKSGLAIEIAGEIGAEIINADSLQVYKSLNIGTAKPTLAERQLVPHHLFDIIEDNGSFNAAEFRKAALNLLKKEHSRGKIFFVVGGSGFYIQALYRGMFEAPSATAELKQSLKIRIETEGSQKLWTELHSYDPEYATKINPNDGYRIQRALEIILTFGKKMSDVQGAFKPEPFPFQTLFIGLNPSRDFLRSTIETRTKKMLELGLVSEVEGLLAKGLTEWAPLKSVGYFEVLQFLRGQISELALQPLIVTHTMQLAKRQMTWFKRWPEIEWSIPEPESVTFAQELFHRIAAWSVAKQQSVAKPNKI